MTDSNASIAHINALQSHITKLQQVGSSALLHLPIKQKAIFSEFANLLNHSETSLSSSAEQVILGNLQHFNISRYLFVTDIETTGVSVNAKIGSIGVAVLDLVDLVVVDRFYERVDLDSQPDRISNESTLSFWESQKTQSPAAWAEMFLNPDRKSLSQSLIELKELFDKHSTGGVINVLGNGPEFDCVILETAYKGLGIDLPWTFRACQSLRTFCLIGRVYLGIDPKYQHEPVGWIPHNALSDAEKEAGDVISILGHLKARLF